MFFPSPMIFDWLIPNWHEDRSDISGQTDRKTFAASSRRVVM